MNDLINKGGEMTASRQVVELEEVTSHDFERAGSLVKLVQEMNKNLNGRNASFRALGINLLTASSWFRLASLEGASPMFERVEEIYCEKLGLGEYPDFGDNHRYNPVEFIDFTGHPDAFDMIEKEFNTQFSDLPLKNAPIFDWHHTGLAKFSFSINMYVTDIFSFPEFDVGGETTPLEYVEACIEKGDFTFDSEAFLSPRSDVFGLIRETGRRCRNMEDPSFWYEYSVARAGGEEHALRVVKAAAFACR
jgi:hypothetical protein